MRQGVKGIIPKFVAGGRKKRGKAHDELILAKAAAEKLVGYGRD